jgi:hypothetical protein
MFTEQLFDGGLRLIDLHFASPIKERGVDPRLLSASIAGGGCLCESVNQVDGVDLLPIKANLCKIDSKILFEKHDNLYRIDRLKASTEQQGVLIHQRLIVAAVGQEFLNKLMNLCFSLHEGSLKTDEEQARKKS